MRTYKVAARMFAFLKNSSVAGAEKVGEKGNLAEVLVERGIIIMEPKIRFRFPVGAALMCVLIAGAYLFFLGDTKYRVWWHHGLSLPADARNLHCTGCSGMPCYQGKSEAIFNVARAELSDVLGQFHQDEAETDERGRVSYTAGPPIASAALSGETSGWSPAGNNRIQLKWHEASPGRVEVWMQTDAN